MFQLKNYQQRAIETLADFFSQCRQGIYVSIAYKNSVTAQGMSAIPYREYGFGQVPYVCFRIPTGGGKTILGSYAIEIAAKQYLEIDYPITLWLVPTNTIRLQTVEALKTPGHPYRAKLDASFKHQVLVLDIDEVTQIRPQDIGGKAIVVVSTLANLRVNDTSGRKVYAYHENFEPHFSKLTANHPSMPMLERVGQNDIQENGLSDKEIGKVKFSFANLLALHRPLIIMDEAHNARTSLTFETLQRVHPAAIVELTATPNMSATNGSNVLFHVSAAELKAEEMIKLPIILTEHQSWQDAIQDAVITRNKLHIDAQNDTDYIRPIALFQAEPKNGEVTVEVLKDYLVNHQRIGEEKIAVATGTQRELDGLNLFDPKCPIEYIITIEALKEGWDCSFAYVFCSVKQVSSSKDAEQLLGRVLRMPYAKRRVIEDLNRAYAHLSTTKFSRAAQELTDKLIAMGFEEMEIAAFLKQNDTQPDFFDGAGQAIPKPATKTAVVFELPKMPDVSVLSAVEAAQVNMTQDGDKTIVRVTGEISETLEKIITDTTRKKEDIETIARDIRIHNQSIYAAKAPSEKGECFGHLPMLCIQEQGELELVEPDILLNANNWELSRYSSELKNFSVQENTNTWSIDMDGTDLSLTLADDKDVIHFNEGFLSVTEQDLIRWLDRELQQKDVLQSQLVGFLSSVVNALLKQPNVTLTGLVRNKHKLARSIRDLIKIYRTKAQAQAYQTCLFGSDNNVCLSDQFVYEFSPANYPSRPPYYSGRYKFQKHFFPIGLIEDLKAQGEEYECAKAIDTLPQVKYWIRNLVRRDHASFWLPLAQGKFYPDFICELNDGRMLVVEYKGEAYATNDDSAEKRAVGELWAQHSKGNCLFIMAVEQDKEGRDVRQQILALVN
jgi:type III restriction enzyme